MTADRAVEHKVLLEPGGFLVPTGSRVAYLFEGPAERTRFAPFIASGLAERNKCVIVTDDEGHELFVRALTELGVNVEERERDGSLLLITNAIALGIGDSEPRTVFQDLRLHTEALRFINDTSSMGLHGWKDRHFLRFEVKSHLLAEQKHATVICQYDAGTNWRWRLNQVLTSHHFTVVSPRVEKNPDRRPRGQIIFDSMGEHLRALSRLQGLSLNLTASLELDQLLDAILQAAMTVCQADSAAISCLDDSGELRIMRHAGLSEEYMSERRLNRQDPAIAKLMANREPAIIEDIEELADVSNNYMAWKREGIKSIVSLPLVSEGQVFGMIAAGANAPRHYTQSEIDAMAIMAAQAGAAIINARLFEQLRGANRAKDEFLAILSHELRTPLTPILGWMHMLRRFTESDPLLAQGIEAVERNARQLAGLINDLLDLSRAVTGKIELSRERTDLSALVQSAINQVSPLALGLHIAVEAHLPDHSMYADVDPVRIQQVVGNLLNNAVKFTPKDGSVTVSLSADAEGRAVIEVKDTGIGIDPRFLPRVFERFTQAHSGMNRGYGGLGLGLAITRAMVEEHGGDVTAESAGLDQGSVFRVRLPGVAQLSASPADELTAFATDPMSIEALGFRVIVVEDSVDTLDMIQLWLTSFGCDVQVAARSSDALKLAVDHPPDLIISDIGLPEVDGYELIRKLRQTPGLERIPAVALTGYAHESDRELALAAGYDAHLSKPTEMHRLLQVIKKLVRKQP